MKFTFLGTAAAEGFPGMFCSCATCERARKAGGRNLRGRSQALVNDDLLIDFPADTCQRTLQGHLDLPRIRHCLVTHSHSDHLYPADVEMRKPGFAYPSDEQPFVFYASEKTARPLQERLGAYRMDDNGSMQVKIIRPFEPFAVNGYTVTPLQAVHDPTTEPLMYMISDGDKTVLYAHDTDYFSDDTWAYLEALRPKLDMVSLDCTGVTIRYVGSHMNMETGVQVVERLRALGCVTEQTKLVVHHFSHNCGYTHDELLPVAAASGFDVSYDNCVVEL